MSIFVVQSKLENLKAVRDWLGKVLSGYGFDEKTRFAIVTATNEVVTNVIVHTYKEASFGKVGIEVGVSENLVEVRVFDFRPGYQISLKSSSDPESGFGLRIVRNLMDEFFHFHDERGNNFVLRKHVSTRVRSK